MLGAPSVESSVDVVDVLPKVHVEDVWCRISRHPHEEVDVCLIPARLKHTSLADPDVVVLLVRLVEDGPARQVSGVSVVLGRDAKRRPRHHADGGLLGTAERRCEERGQDQSKSLQSDLIIR